MTKTFEQEMEELAKRYANQFVSKPKPELEPWQEDIASHHKAGAQAAKRYFEKAGGEFDRDFAYEGAKHHQGIHGDSQFVKGARWQHDQLSPLLAARDLRIAELEETLKYIQANPNAAHLWPDAINRALEKGRQG